ncbi:hypothetical protein XENORESO_001343 [Xenotaenia resolanae]|uniref:Uncharacterized protein n=1 Tax=Xenotaenia resolanae TaxID=208358 RepID=A0ABV0WLP9_9TELE
MGVHVLTSGVEQPLFGHLTFPFRPPLTDRRPSRPPGRTASPCVTEIRPSNFRRSLGNTLSCLRFTRGGHWRRGVT